MQCTRKPVKIALLDEGRDGNGHSLASGVAPLWMVGWVELASLHASLIKPIISRSCATISLLRVIDDLLLPSK